MNNTKFKYALIDLDGTLINSEGGIARCLKLALSSIGIENVTEKRIKEMIGPPFVVSMKTFYGKEGQTVEKMLKVYRGQYDIDGWSDIKIYDGIWELLDTLKKKGLTLAVATSKPRKFTDKIIEKFGFKSYFDYVGAAEADGVKESKREVINSVFANHNIQNPEEVIMIGDTKYDIIGAKESGVASIGVLWGFGKREDFVKEDADYILETPKDVADFFNN